MGGTEPNVEVGQFKEGVKYAMEMVVDALDRDDHTRLSQMMLGGSDNSCYSTLVKQWKSLSPGDKKIVTDTKFQFFVVLYSYKIYQF